MKWRLIAQWLRQVVDIDARFEGFCATGFAVSEVQQLLQNLWRHFFVVFSQHAHRGGYQLLFLIYLAGKFKGIARQVTLCDWRRRRRIARTTLICGRKSFGNGSALAGLPKGLRRISVRFGTRGVCWGRSTLTVGRSAFVDRPRKSPQRRSIRRVRAAARSSAPWWPANHVQYSGQRTVECPEGSNSYSKSICHLCPSLIPRQRTRIVFLTQVLHLVSSGRVHQGAQHHAECRIAVFSAEGRSRLGFARTRNPCRSRAGKRLKCDTLFHGDCEDCARRSALRHCQVWFSRCVSVGCG